MKTTETARAGASMATRARRFPASFVWGAATAAYQIEGAPAEDGRKPSIWDTFSHTPGKVLAGDTGDVACDHYHRVAEDVALMAELGLQSYRFSVAWPRIVPTGSGEVNRAGLDFYSRLVDQLLEHQIDPAVTLYHWDLPQPLEDAGGWTNRETAARFAEYAQVVGQALGDRVKTFITLNEPWCSAFLGYAAGMHAPGRTSLADGLAAAHHLNLAHGLGTSALRSVLPADRQVMLTVNPALVRAASDSPADRDAARHVDAIANRIFLDPVFGRGYPDDLLADMRHVTDWAFVREGDAGLIGVPIDALGVNYYTPMAVCAATPDGSGSPARGGADPLAATGPAPFPGTDLAYAMPLEGPRTAMNWVIEPAGLTELLVRLHRDYPDTPLVVTENGAAFDDAVAADGAIHDSDRVAYLDGHAGAVHDAIAAGVDVRGYYLWSLMDNFEWIWGYSKRFGIVRVDFTTQERTVKDSGRWYQRVIATNGLD